VSDPSRLKQLGDCNRNSLVREYAIVSEEQFEKALNCKFICKFDPRTGEPYYHTFKKEDMVELKPDKSLGGLGEDSHLFKLTARDWIK